MRAIILAAGRGSRMGELTKEKPKGLTFLKGKPLIEHQISSLSNAGVKKIAIVTGYKAEYFKEYTVHQFYNPLWQKTNMVYSLLCAQSWLKESDCIVSYSDIFYSSTIVRKLINSKENISISYDPNWLELWKKRFKNPLEDAETFRIDDEEYLIEIGQKPKTIEEVQGQYMGLLRFRKEVWENINIPVSLTVDMTSFLNSLIRDGHKIKAILNEDPWGEIDSVQDVAVYE